MKRLLFDETHSDPHAAEDTSTKPPVYGQVDPVRTMNLAAALAPLGERRAQHHQQRYGVPEHSDEPSMDLGPE